MQQSNLIKKLCKDNPKLTFKVSESYYWSPKNKTVYYQKDNSTPIGLWALIHETCHGLLNHKTYQSDFELVKLEVSAWGRAENLAKKYGLMIDEDHIQDCLDSYRDWQYKRSICPRCSLGGVQINQNTYSCMFCMNSWNVSSARFCRPYRRQAIRNKV